ncbi:unnamed protein product [Phytophthora lilii]|uniref:Unnamed protein product n=1 Tax=Phytophthora lilii TaxID=2077276 RepID=A0A9W6WQP4_9STRA|nr:unnamed protein product [Phytophthora lilii]
MLFLPATRLRVFEPFRKQTSSCKDPEAGESSFTGSSRARRGVPFQLMELLAAYLLLTNASSLLFLPGALLANGAITCGSFVSQTVALGAVVGYAGLFVVLYYFARYRIVTIMMQVEAFHESDQAGNLKRQTSYTHSHLEFARKLRQSLEEANVTTWLDLMDPSGPGYAYPGGVGDDRAMFVLCGVDVEANHGHRLGTRSVGVRRRQGSTHNPNSAQRPGTWTRSTLFACSQQAVPFHGKWNGLQNKLGYADKSATSATATSQYEALSPRFQGAKLPKLVTWTPSKVWKTSH